MPIRPTAMDFAPLITPERLADDPLGAFTVRPDWVWHIVPADPDFPNRWADPSLVMVIGDKRRKSFILTPAEVAIILEAARADINGRTIPAGNNIYGAFRIVGAQEDNQMWRRVFYGARGDEVAKTHDNPSDLRPENLYAKGEYGRPEKDARAVFMAHAERLASARASAGLWLTGLTIPDYLDNLRRHFAAIDKDGEAADWQG